MYCEELLVRFSVQIDNYFIIFDYIFLWHKFLYRLKIFPVLRNELKEGKLL